MWFFFLKPNLFFLIFLRNIFTKKRSSLQRLLSYNFPFSICIYVGICNICIYNIYTYRYIYLYMEGQIFYSVRVHFPGGGGGILVKEFTKSRSFELMLLNYLYELVFHQSHICYSNILLPTLNSNLSSLRGRFSWNLHTHIIKVFLIGILVIEEYLTGSQSRPQPLWRAYFLQSIGSISCEQTELILPTQRKKLPNSPKELLSSCIE